jgi:hypothetical protein
VGASARGGKSLSIRGCAARLRGQRYRPAVVRSAGGQQGHTVGGIWCVLAHASAPDGPRDLQHPDMIGARYVVGEITAVPDIREGRWRLARDANLLAAEQ